MNFRAWFLPAAAVCCLLASAPVSVSAQAPALTPAAQANQRLAAAGILANHTAPQVLNGTAQLVSRYESSKKLRLALSVQPPHLAEEEQFIADLQTKGSPNFHQFLTAAEWNARFAPSAADEQKVVDWAESQGLHVTNRFSHRLIVDVEGTVADIEKAFNVLINNYQVADELDFANDRDPVLPPALQGIVTSVQGLNSIQREHGASPASNRVKGPDYSPGPARQAHASDRHDGDPSKLPAGLAASLSANAVANDLANGTTPNAGYISPQNLYSSAAYNYAGLQALGHCCNPYHEQNGAPPSSSIAIAAFGNFQGSDISGFQAGYPYLSFNYDSYTIDGAIDCTKSANASVCPSSETTQDLEWSLATANSFGSYLDTAHIYVYVGVNQNNQTFTDMYSQMLHDDTARVFSTSWSCTEVYQCSDSVMDSRHNIFNQMVGQGWTLVAASGDRGASDDCNTGHIAVAYPGSDYNVVAAGGTELLLYSNGTFDYEVAWSGGFTAPNPKANPPIPGSCAQNNGGSGGGVSSYYGKPSWQSSINLGSKRMVPDLSLNAFGEGQNLYLNGSWGGDANGTSVSAPELAGFFAQENAYLAAIGSKCGSNGTSSCQPVGNPNPFIYAAGVYNDNAHNPFYDITSGCNSNNITSAGNLSYYCSLTGYDLVTGWGSANMMQLAWAINWQLIPASGIPNVAFSGPVTGRWYNTNQTVSWTINDYNGGGIFPGTGIAGFTQGWDSIPHDATSEAHGGTGDSFYSGPQFPNASGGCLALVGNGCAGGVSQGCHYAHVEGWNNQGQDTGDATYGPICYDTVDPVVSLAYSPLVPAGGWYNHSVQVSMTPTDPGGNTASGIAHTYYGFNNPYCYAGATGNCSTYSGPFTINTQGNNYIYYLTIDNAGNYSTEGYSTLKIDETAPSTAALVSGTLGGSAYTTPVSISLSAGDTLSGVAATYYTLDGGSLLAFTAPIAVSSLGKHVMLYYSVDVAGNVEATHNLVFTLATPPATPTFSETPGSYAGGVAVALSDATVGAKIYYSISGGPYLLYSTPIVVTASETISAAATLNGVNSAYVNAAYTITGGTTVAPTFSLPSGVYTGTIVVSLSETMPGAQIYYSINGGSYTLYSTPITITADESAAAPVTITAGATLNGVYSTAVSKTYTINPGTAAPTFYPVPGTYSGTQMVSLSDTTPGAQIYYSINGARYAPYTVPIAVSTSESITVGALANSVGSAYATGSYTIVP